MKRGFFREREFTQFSLDKKGLTNNQWIILGVVIFLLVVFIIAVNYSSSVRNVFVGDGELRTLYPGEESGESLETGFLTRTCDVYNEKDKCEKNPSCEWVEEGICTDSNNECSQYNEEDCKSQSKCFWDSEKNLCVTIADCSKIDNEVDCLNARCGWTETFSYCRKKPS